jgi:regulatory protein YycI of two-component signal transduction system YycFG
MLSALSFRANPKVLIRGAIIVLALVIGLKVWGFVETAIENQNRIIEQEVVIQLKDDEIETLQGVIEQNAESVRIAEEAEAEIEALEAELETIRDRALTAGDDRDGPLAPVLQDTLRALRD